MQSWPPQAAAASGQPWKPRVPPSSVSRQPVVSGLSGLIVLGIAASLWRVCSRWRKGRAGKSMLSPTVAAPQQWPLGDRRDCAQSPEPVGPVVVTVVKDSDSEALTNCRQRPTPTNRQTENREEAAAATSPTAAAAVVRCHSFGTRPRRVQPIFDIDDTIKSSGGHTAFGIPLGGVDVQYDRGALYPGVGQFALELARHGLPAREVPAPVAVLTARPRELGPALKLHQGHRIVSAFNAVGVANGYPGWGVGWDKGCVLYGSVQEWVRADMRGWRKFENFKEQLRVCSNSDVGGADRNCYVLVGDTGDRDMDCAEMMLKEYHKDVIGVFMHVVSASANYEMPRDMTINGRQILFFRTYPGAARKAVAAGLMSNAAMLRVCDEAHRDLLAMSGAIQGGGWEAEEDATEPCSRRADLLRDIELCRVVAQHGSDLLGREGGPLRCGGSTRAEGCLGDPQMAL